MHRGIAIGLLAAASCTGEITGPPVHGDVEAGIVVLEGEALATELAASPVREAPEPFVRLGLVWDAPRPDALEVAWSADGQVWSEWRAPVVQHVEVEAATSFVGHLEVEGEAALYYRLRGTPDAATFLRLEWLTTTLDESAEDGEDGVQYAQIGAADVHGRSAWGARPTRCTSRLGSAYRMAIHHTETPTNDSLSPQARLRQIQSYHMDVRGWCDIGYHYLMSRDGQLWEGRPGHLLGAHAGGGNNSGNLGISVMGSHDGTPITETQLGAISALVRGLADTHGIALDRARIKGHREYKATTCPGAALFAQLADIVARARQGAVVADDDDDAGDPDEGGGDAATGNAGLQGVIYRTSDSSKRIGGAQVTLSTGHTITADQHGYYKVTGLPAGPVTITATAAGYPTGSVSRTLIDGDVAWGSVRLE